MIAAEQVLVEHLCLSQHRLRHLQRDQSQQRSDPDEFLLVS